MQTLIFLCVAIAAVVAVPPGPPAPAVLAGVAATAVNPNGKLTCIKGILGPAPAYAAKIGACKDPAVWGTEPGKKNPNCDGKCIGEALEYWGPDGKPDKAKYLAWIDADFAGHQVFAKKHMENCFESFATKIDLNDSTCEFIKKFDSCGWEMQPKLTC